MIGMLLFVLRVWLEQFTSVIQVGVKGESWHQVQTHLFNASISLFKQTALIYVWTKKKLSKQVCNTGRTDKVCSHSASGTVYLPI